MKFESKATLQQQAWLWITAILAIVIDQLTKFRIEAIYTVGESYYPIPAISDMFRIIHVINLGAAWGTFEGYGFVFAGIAILVMGYLLYMNTTIEGDFFIFRILLGFIGGGAMGNAIDRFRLGHVTDFIDINFRPLVAGTFLDRPFLDLAIFNWADVFIIGGVLVLGVLMWTDYVPEPDEPAAEPQPKIPPPFSTPTSFEGYQPALAPPDINDTNRAGWTQARTAVWVLALLVVSLGIWFVSWGISSRASRRKQRRSLRNSDQTPQPEDGTI